MDLFQYSGRGWSECLILEKALTATSPPKALDYRPIRLLPRMEFPLYGEYPKLENKLLYECLKCGIVLSSSSFKSHFQHPDHDKKIVNNLNIINTIAPLKPVASSKSTKPGGTYIPPGTSLLKKKYQQPKNKKKLSLPPPVPPPPLFSVKTSTNASSTTVTLMAAVPPDVPVIAQLAQQPAPAAPPPTQNAAPAVSSTATAGRHKKNKKSRKKSKEEMPSIEKVEKVEKSPAENGPAPKPPIAATKCGPLNGKITKIYKPKPCATNILQESNKLTSTKIENKIEAYLRNHLKNVKCVKVVKLMTPRSVQDKAKTEFVRKLISNNISRKVATVSPLPSTKIKILQSIQIRPPRRLLSNHTLENVESPSPPMVLPPIVNSLNVQKVMPVIPHIRLPPKLMIQQSSVQVVAPRSTSKPQGNMESLSSVDYRPMSPVVNNVPLQFLQLPVLRVASTQPLLSPPLATQPIVVTIPLQSNNAPIYTSHPKPISMTTRSIRKIGAAYLLQNQRIVNHRNEVQSLVNTRRTVINSMNYNHHRPNILKSSARNNVKISVKRASSDKLLNDNNKHIRLNDVNGFILHADVSESAEAPLHNNSVHDKVTFLNMK